MTESTKDLHNTLRIISALKNIIVPNITASCQKYLCCMIKSSPKPIIAVAWFSSMFLVIIGLVIACVASAYMDGSGIDQAVSFAAVWTMLILILFSIFGSFIVKKHATPIGIGFLLGSIFILCNQMLILFAVFVDKSSTSITTSNTEQRTDARGSFAAISFFIFILYASVGTLLAVFRADVFSNAEASLQPDEEFVSSSVVGSNLSFQRSDPAINSS